jgi:hypothetical protein
MPTYRLPVVINAPNASPSVNVWHFRTGLWMSDTLDATSSAAAVAAIRSMYSSLAAYYPAGATISSEGPVNVVTSEAGGGTWASISGTGTGGNLPSILALCASWKTSIRARRGTGRTFFGPLVPGFLQSDGSITDAVLTQFRTNVGVLVDASKAANGWAVGVYGQESAMPGASAEARALAPHVFRDVVSFTIKDRFSVMRSRRP